jgi:hypothetical protein
MIATSKISGVVPSLCYTRMAALAHGRDDFTPPLLDTHPAITAEQRLTMGGGGKIP